MNTQVKKPQRYLGPSQFATALGLSQFKTPEQLRSEMENGYTRELSPQLVCGIAREGNGRVVYRQSLETDKNLIKPQWRTYTKNQRIGGCADGLIVNSDGVAEGLLEVKCHYQKAYPLSYIPIYYLVQVTGYLAMYNLPWCDLISCCFDNDGNLIASNTIRVTWEEVKERWENDWLPKLNTFTNSVQWADLKN